MSNIYNKSNPETWGIPSNYEGSSCFMDSMLWAVLYKIDNPFYKYIYDAKFNENSEADICKNLLLAFYGGIHGGKSSDELKEIIGGIRNLLKDDMRNGQHDTNEFFNELKEILDKDIQKNIKIESTTTKIIQDNNNNNNTEEKKEEVKSETNFLIANSPIGFPIGSSYFDTVTFDINDKTITITGPKIQENTIITEEDKTKPSVKQIDNSGKPYLNKEGQQQESYPTKNTGKTIISSQVTTTYTSDKKIDYLMIPIGRINEQNNKDKTKIKISEKIGELSIHSIVVHQGENISGGHYYCYFKVNNMWYLFDDLKHLVENLGVSNFDKLLNNKSEINTNCACLFYTIDDDESKSTDINQNDYQKYYDFINQYLIKKQKQIQKVQQQNESIKTKVTNDDSKQATDMCKQHFKEWDELFLDNKGNYIVQNAVTNIPPQPVKKVEPLTQSNLIQVPIARSDSVSSTVTELDTDKDKYFIDDKNTVISTTGKNKDEYENRTLFDSNSEAEKKVLEDKADKALENAKKIVDTITNEKVKKIIGRAQKGDEKYDIIPVEDKKSLSEQNKDEIVFFNNNVYVVLSKGKGKIFYNVNSNKEENINDITGGTITKKRRNINIKETRKRKRKGNLRSRSRKEKRKLRKSRKEKKK